ncbi:uncharacterized protein FIBRA_05928 [Fibroporia radiculosa]|uniref:Tubulin-specific chaperone A n=1 Tax=Fibroporia radiculosa TaxID=599839 RepID=J4IAZ7_9APHY|nr:uncharacterized protein FIBRA_05928 [Fibroporia radiculosa]CCM03781.1 predicted protein [Fibroporia radiculosa]
MSDTAATRRQLKIKSGSCKRIRRLFKEHKSYQKEEEDQKRKLDRLIANTTDPDDWDVKNARRMLDENQRMIADAATRLGKAVQDLRDVVVFAKQDSALAEDEALMQAEEALEEKYTTS